MNWLSLQTLAQTSTEQRLIERMLNALPEGFLIALFAWALLRVLRKQNSGTRFAVWFVALLTVAVLPGLGGFGQGQALMVAGMSWAMTSGMSSAMTSAMSAEHIRPAITIPGRWALVVFLAWAFGASVAMARLAAGFWNLRRLRQSCIAIDIADLDPVVRETVETIGASGAVTIATSESVRVPAAIGFWKRTIVLPAWALRELPPEDLNVILLHEFAHLRRGDDWTNLIQKIVRALFFFHPAVWWIEKRLSVEREMACDDAVLAETANPRGYATCLVSLLEKSLSHRLAHRRWSMVQAAVDRAREASQRLARILDANRPMATRVWKPALGMVGAFSVVCLAVLPLAPQFVAFDRGVLASNSDPVYSAAVVPAQNASVIPAMLRAGESAAAVVTAKMTTARMTAKMTTVKVAHAQVVPAQIAHTETQASMNANPSRDQMVAISASADQEIAPQFQTLVLVEATQFRTSDSMVWRVQVWHVMLVSAACERLARVPVANSI